MTVEVTSGFTAFEAPVAAFEIAAPLPTISKPVNDKPWSARARLGFILFSAILAWMGVIAAVVEIVRLIEAMIW